MSAKNGKKQSPLENKANDKKMTVGKNKVKENGKSNQKKQGSSTNSGSSDTTNESEGSDDQVNVVVRSKVKKRSGKPAPRSQTLKLKLKPT